MACEEARASVKAVELQLMRRLHISDARNEAAAAAAKAEVAAAADKARQAAAAAAAAADAGPPLVPQRPANRSGGDSSAVALHSHAGPQPDRLPPPAPAAAAARLQSQPHCPCADCAWAPKLPQFASSCSPRPPPQLGGSCSGSTAPPPQLSSTAAAPDSGVASGSGCGSEFSVIDCAAAPGSGVGSGSGFGSDVSFITVDDPESGPPAPHV